MFAEIDYHEIEWPMRGSQAGLAERVPVDAPPLDDSLLSLNDALSRLGAKPLNQGDLEKFADALARISYTEPELYCLTLARISELSLFCAGGYADAGEFTAAGDLLVNPRQVEICFNNGGAPLHKNPHLALREQMKPFMGEADPVCWMIENTRTRIVKPALLPELLHRLNQCAIIAEDYISSVEARMGRIANTIAFLSAWRITDACRLYEKRHQAEPEVRAFIDQNLCCFDLALFNELGKDIQQLLAGGSQSRFLKCGSVVWLQDKPFFAPFAMSKLA